MQFQMSSGASAPSLAPNGPNVAPPVPTLVPPKQKPPRGRRLGLIVALIVGAIGVERGVHYVRQSGAESGAAKAAVVRTAVVTQGSVVRALRLTGTTGAE